MSAAATELKAAVKVLQALRAQMDTFAGQIETIAVGMGISADELEERENAPLLTLGSGFERPPAPPMPPRMCACRPGTLDAMWDTAGCPVHDDAPNFMRGPW